MPVILESIALLTAFFAKYNPKRVNVSLAKTISFPKNIPIISK